ncbi:alpha/beta fold hydrolase [Companilactobacillus nantensis]|uniref:Putative lipase esterase (Putative) n=1 Tax=Companilactobacillus nantensis DSM 16982 TaxID=1423774 RepID=A0A0R1WMC4_9LACO|nr:alpha/beta fold hydrolase [Companilactobacillus nantensis]KRM17380.1 putative lipase esterase (putative) [Companilactobacillus nantensis DSM 16982]GEO63904.1 lipase/esterase [Companilactobacillus nantensis]
MTKIYQQMIQDVPILEVTPEEPFHKQLPLVIFYHGWRSSKELVLTQARKLAQKNIRVVLPDAMNHGQRITDISSIPSFTFWNSIQGNLSEFSLIRDYYKDKDLIKDGKIGVGGYSMGGMTTGALLTAHPEITAAAIIMGTPDLALYAKLVRQDAKRRGIYVPEDLEKLTGWINDYDLSQHPEKINHRPLLFWHGTNDYRIPYRQSKDFFDRVHGESYADQVAFITGYKAGHLVETRLMDKVANFFEYYLE